jgi:DNA-binding transcriptional MerR regulator
MVNGVENFTVSQAAQHIGESVHVVRNWLKDLREHIPAEKSPAGYNLFNQDGIKVLKDIKYMVRGQNLTTKQIEGILSAAGSAVEIEDIQESNVVTEDVLKELLDKQRLEFENFIRKRDEQMSVLLLEIRELRDEKRRDNNRQYGWLKWISKLSKKVSN